MADLSAPLTGFDGGADAPADGASLSRDQQESQSRGSVAQNLLAGATTSFAAIALGAAFGDACGRGALVGILSAGTIAVITAAIGGTRVQCSGPTAPMTTVTTTVVAYSRSAMFDDVTSDFTAASPGCGIDDYDSALCPLPDRFVNIVLLLGGLLIAMMGVLRLGQYITLVPNIVISGFMNGIAVQIWQKEVIRLSGSVLHTTPSIRGYWPINLGIAFCTTALCFLLPRMTRKLLPLSVAKSVPTTLCVIGALTAVGLAFDNCKDCDDCANCIEKTELGASLESFSDLQQLVNASIPTMEDVQTEGVLPSAVTYALQLAVLCYLDTLLTSLVVDKMVQERDDSEETTNKAKELGAQGVANAAVSLFGGLPGAQATIRSVLILKEGGTMRLAGVFAGCFVLVEMIVFQKFVQLIPQAVFSGVLIKIGYDVFDFSPVVIYLKAIGQARMDACLSVEALRSLHTLAVSELEEHQSTGTLARMSVAIVADSEAAALVPEHAVEHRRAAVQRYADALTRRGEQAAGWAEVEASERARQRGDDARRQSVLFAEAAVTPRQRMTRALVQRTQSAGQSAFSTLVDTSKPLPHVGHVAMLFILGTTLVTVLVNLNAAVGTFTLAFHLLRVCGGGRFAVDDLTIVESKHGLNDANITTSASRVSGRHSVAVGGGRGGGAGGGGIAATSSLPRGTV